MHDKSLPVPVSFHFLQQSSLPKERTGLKTFIAAIFKKENTPLNSLTFIFCSDAYLLGINLQFLDHNYYTDVISFNLAGKQEAIEGEIYISLDRVRDNAKSLRVSLNAELHRVIFHGVLHLCGYKDKKTAEIALMRAREDFYLGLYLG